ncbi:hypothetical protein ABVT39_002264, partial [Epinephelus coioides]
MHLVQNKESHIEKEGESKLYNSGGVQRCGSLLKWSSSVAFTRVLRAPWRSVCTCVQKLDSPPPP